ncbi:hypothetical protein [Planotetraspora kaengkrachanensis]|uniref:Uncharacterized protein n=1 Tax=Planotetraspora kaengkrachanensis TaxID=575193 RepID=A0A8J3PXZ9_9ACTN|nr:hypothetical protein [Planotetraspora kaengkrachanensis]GIG83160.1 hypothetical protein Pka01_62870 [Planotetraspora kaengkrachanensis]
MRTEQDLRAVLRRAADQAAPPAGLVGALRRARRRRRTRRRYQAALAFAGVVIVAAGGSVVFRGGADDSPATNTRTNTKEVAPTTMPDPNVHASDRPAVKKSRPARVVWPQAVSTIPAEAGDGARYSALAALSPTEVLLRADKKSEKTTRIDVYDTRTGVSRVLTQVPVIGNDYRPIRFEVGAEYIGWYAMTPDDTSKGADLWIALRAGGPAIKVAETTDDMPASISGPTDEWPASISVTADSLVWSLFNGGIYRVPITGGSPEKIAGSDGLWLTSWPWAADLPPYQANPDPDHNQTRLVNLETGEKRDFVIPPGVVGLRCSTSWCSGILGRDMIVMRPDGSGLSRVPRFASFEARPAGSHFVEVEGTIYDLATGTTATIGRAKQGKDVAYERGPTSSPTTLFSWEDGHGGLEVLNMLAVDR